MDRLKKKKGPSNYINHSCKPNCKLKQWGIDGLPLMCFFANKDMKCDEELRIHYNWELAVKNEEEFKEKATKCKCETQK
jgi:SET domain-containing protein